MFGGNDRRSPQNDMCHKKIHRKSFFRFRAHALRVHAYANALRRSVVVPVQDHEFHRVGMILVESCC
jgi:hypothetical protein